MQVTVELFSYFQKGRFNQDTVDIPTGSTAEELAAHLGIDISDVGVLIINGNSGTRKYRLRTGDRVTFIPIIGGG